MSVTKYKTITLDHGKTQEVSFGTKVLNAHVAVQGFDIEYSKSSKDHHVHQIKVKASMDGISDDTVTVSVTSMFKDHEGNEAKGNAEVLVTAECDA